VRISKLMSLALRHDPGALGIALDANGWTDVDTLLRRPRSS
jgi:putative RNA 2'-phosphotransferase